MSRALRVEYPGAIYHAMARGVARMPVFDDDQDRLCLLHQIEVLIETGALLVHAFCLMLNHIHLLCETPFGGMSRWMQQILGNYGRIFNDRHSRSGHLWQGRYRAILVQEGEYLLDCSQYIHLNPCRAKIVNSPEDYEWSSYRSYCAGSPIVPWVCTQRILSYFGEREDYRRFVVAGKEQKQLSPLKRSVAGIAFGNREFVESIRELAKGMRLSAEVPSHRALLRGPLQISAEEIREEVDAVFGDRSLCQRRRILIWALHRYAWMKGCEIGHIVGLRPSSVSVAIRTIESRRLLDSCLAGRLPYLEENIRRRVSYLQNLKCAGKF